MGPCARMCQTHQGRDSPPPDFAKIRCQKVGKSEMGKILVLGHEQVVRADTLGSNERQGKLLDLLLKILRCSLGARISALRCRFPLYGLERKIQ